MGGKKQKPKVLEKELFEGQRDRLTKIKSMQRQNDIVKMLLDGEPKINIAKYIAAKYDYLLRNVYKYIDQAIEEVKKRKDYEIENLIDLHIMRYERIYASANSLELFALAMNALKAKERLLGFHRQGFHMKVTKGEIQQIQQMNVKDEYDFNKLSPEKKLKLEYYLDKVYNHKKEIDEK